MGVCVSGTGSAKLKLIDVPPYEALLEAVKRAYEDVNRAKYKLKDLALVSILVFTGCRLGEALRLRREDFDLKRRTVRIRQLKKRGEFYRIVPVPSRLFWEIIERYLRREFTDYLFPPGELSKDKTREYMTDRQARNVVYKWSKRYLRRKIRPHAIRHSYAIAVLKATKNLEAVRRLLGHEDYKTLKSYLDFTQEDLEQELEKVFERL